MTLPALADIPALDARIPGGLADADTARAQAALDDASALIRAEAGTNWTNDDGTELEDVPDVVVTICIAAARRALTNPDGVTEEAVGDARRSYSESSLDVFLKASEKALIRRAAGSFGGITTIATTREDPINTSDFGTVDRDGTIYCDVTPDGQPIPYLNVDQFAP